MNEPREATEHRLKRYPPPDTLVKITVWPNEVAMDYTNPDSLTINEAIQLSYLLEQAVIEAQKIEWVSGNENQHELMVVDK